jgi:hypothetical protein
VQRKFWNFATKVTPMDGVLFSRAAKILEFVSINRRNSINRILFSHATKNFKFVNKRISNRLTVFGSPRSENFGICHQNQLKSTVFCSAAQRKSKATQINNICSAAQRKF